MNAKAPNPWPALAIEPRAIASLKPYEKNPRVHGPEQIEAVARSITEFGWTMPVLITEGGQIIAGHGRIEAAKTLGIEEAPCVVARGWTKAQIKAYVIADNRLTERSTWDEQLLRSELLDLSAMGFDLDLTGFADEALAKLLAEPEIGNTDPDDIPEVPKVPVSRPGDLWILGNHRLICGDSTDRETVERLLDGVRPNLMVTDPPYGVNYDPNWRNEAGTEGRPLVPKGSKSKLTGPRPISAPRSTGTVMNDDRADWTDAWRLFPGNIAYVWHGALHAGEVQRSLAEVGFRVRAQIIWAKQHFVFGRGDYHWQHEPCWYAVRSKGDWHGDRRQSTVWEIQNASLAGGKKDDAITGHGTQKPMECMKRPIENNSSPGQAVYEPFNGSGTTIIAAEITGRHCFAVELNPAYVDVAVKRWEAFTGKQAVLEGSGLTFAEATLERAE